VTDDRRTTGGLAASVVAGAAVTYWLPAVSLVLPAARRSLGVRAHVDDAGAVAITFDDGPHPRGTPLVLERLDRAGVRATFFLVGEQVERRPGLAREIVTAGHEVAVHCHRHRNLMRLAPRAVRDDLDRAEAAITDATGADPCRYRPPYGSLTLPALLEARRRRWEIVLWRRDGHDWEAGTTPQRIAARLLGAARGGDVLLLHDADFYSAPGSWQRTVDALEVILERLTAMGLRVASLEILPRTSQGNLRTSR